jgi:hypothetical protein
MPLAYTRVFAKSCRCALQKKGVLSEAALPEELRLALAQNMQNDLFYQVLVGVRTGV